MFPIISRFIALFSLLFLLTCVSLAGCASGPNGTGSVSTAPVDPVAPTTAPDGSSTASPTPAPSFLQFALSINDQGQFDTVNGLYAIILNAFNEPIDVTNNDKFTDFIVYDGTNALWYHRQTLPGDNLFNFVAVANVNQNLSLTEDARTLLITFRTADSSNTLSQFINTNTFTAAAATTDRNGILGRILDTMGPGPSLDNDALYTYFIDKQLGVLRPVPPEYPMDPLNDWVTQRDLGETFPYVNFDIKRFEVTSH